MLKLTGGHWRGRSIQTPKGLSARPTLAKVREAIFSALGDWIDAAHVLDLYAGSGALGFEALSRGAGDCVFVDRSRGTLDLIRRSAEMLDCRAQIALRGGRLPGVIRTLDVADPRRFDLVFMDPPYEQSLVADTLTRLAGADRLAARAMVVVETRHDETFALPQGFETVRDKRYGDTRIRFLLWEATPVSESETQ